MPIFENNGKKVLFIHIPKTGGTSIEKMLGQKTQMTFYSSIEPSSFRVCPQHLPIRDFRVILGENYWDRAFTLVRNPYDRMESEYWYGTVVESRNFNGRPDFSTWVLKYLEQVKRDVFFMDNHFRPQSDFIDSKVEVFRLEDGLEHPVAEMSQFLELSAVPQMRRENSSKREKVSWSLDALNVFNDYYSNDFNLFEYKKIEKKANFFFKNS